MAPERIESLLEKKIGVTAKAVGPETLAQAIDRRLDVCGLPDRVAYEAYLQETPGEWDSLVEEVVIPETWFYRNPNSFAYLERIARAGWTKKVLGKIYRLLSIPASTGEEPYSMAMTLLDAGVPPEAFKVDAVDISEKALTKARTGCYGPESFRGETLAFRDRHFEIRGESFQILSHIQGRVRFFTGNILYKDALWGCGNYDVIFCRNLLIYFGETARQRALENLEGWLSQEGILFVGHAERQNFLEAGFSPIEEPGSFACKRPSPEKWMSPKAATAPAFGSQPSGAQGKAKGQNGGPSRGFVVSPSSRQGRTAPEKEAQDPPSAPAPGSSLFEQARALADQGSLQDALARCERFLRRHPLHVEAHFLMGLIYEALNEEEKAEQFYNRTLYLEPEHPDTLYHLAFLSANRGRRDQAKRLLERARRVSQREGTADSL